MKKWIGFLLMIVLLAACTVSPAEDEARNAGTAAGLRTELDEIREKLSSGCRITNVRYRDASGADIFTFNRQYEQDEINRLWDAANEMTVGEPAEGSGTDPHTSVTFWFSDETGVRLSFAGTCLETAGGKTCRLENDSRFRATLNELTDRYLLTLWIDYRPYILGESTPADLEKNGWELSYEGDNTFAVSQDYLDGILYVTTGDAGKDTPILKINAFWADNFPLEYCGFDGFVSPYLAEGEDPDQRWNREYPYEVLVNSWEDDSIYIDPWGALCTWLTEVYGAEESEEGIYEAGISLSDGRTLSVSSHDSPVCISLIP